MLTKEHLDLLEKLQPLFYRVQDDLKGDDRFYCYACETYFLQKDGDCHCNSYEEERWIRIPDLYSRDESRSERGLLGMINGTWLIQKWDESDYEVTVWDKKGMESFVGTTPTLALLKALAVQEGLEVSDGN